MLYAKLLASVIFLSFSISFWLSVVLQKANLHS